MRLKSVPAIFSALLPGVFALQESRGSHWWAAYSKSTLVAGLITFVGVLIDLRVAPTNAAMFYLAGVVFSALRWGFGPALLSAIISTVAFDYVFIPPYLSFAITDIWYLITFVAMTGIGVLISLLASAAREQTLAARNQAAHTAALYSVTQSLSAARDVDSVLRAAAEHIQTAFGRAVAILRSEGNEELVLWYQSPGWKLDAESQDEAGRVLREAWNDPTIRGRNVFLPLRCGARVIGVLVLLASDSQPELSGAGKRVLEGVADQVALAIDRADLEEQAREAQVLRKAEELQRTLLNSVSHSLRAPLAAIVSALDPIGYPDVMTDPAAVADLAGIAQAEAHRMDTLIGNLLDLSRLEAGALKLRKEPHDIQNIVGAALAEIACKDRLIEVVVPSAIPLLTVDFVFVVRILVNLLDNAIKYSPANRSVGLQARVIGDALELRISDCGCGVPPAERERVFQRFFRRAETEHAPGLGLGLAVCKGFVEAHDGKIWVEERPGGGSIFCFTIPL